MKAIKQSKKILSILAYSLIATSLSACNLFAFVDKPSGDAQLLDYARACLDKGDYACATANYQLLSNSYLDQKISESSLTTLAGKNIFFMGDLFNALGGGKGTASSFSTLAVTLASRSVTDGPSRTIIEQAFLDSSGISDSTLKAYMQFITALAMFNEILANAVTSKQLVNSDIAVNPALCAASGCGVLGAGATTDCTQPANNFLDVNTGGAEVDTTLGMNLVTGWGSSASLEKAAMAVKAANTAAGVLFGTSGGGLAGIFTKLQTLSGLGGGATTVACLQRQLILQTLFP